MLQMKTVLRLAVLSLTLAAVAPAALAQQKIGVFDPQRVSEETQEGKRIQAQLASLKDAKTREIRDKETQLQAMSDQLEQQALTLSPEKRTALQVQIERLRLDLENARKLASQELQLEVAAAQAAFNERLLRAVTAFGKQQGYDVIFEQSLTAYAASTVDVTTGIIDVFDALGPASGGAGN